MQVRREYGETSLESNPIVNYFACPMVSDTMWLSLAEYFAQNK